MAKKGSSGPRPRSLREMASRAAKKYVSRKKK
jgi:hypothetical protein